MRQHSFHPVRFFPHILQKEQLVDGIDFVRCSQCCNQHGKTSPHHFTLHLAGPNNLSDSNLPHPFFPSQSTPKVISAALGQSAGEVHRHHRRMKGHHPTSLQKPV